MKKPKIVILDASCANPGDLSWDSFREIGDVVIYDNTTQEQVIQRACDADIIIDNKVMLTADIIQSLPNLKYIGLLSTGYNVVDIKTAKKRGIPVCNVPSYSTNSVAQHTLALLTALCCNLTLHSNQVNDGQWQNCDKFCFWSDDIIELYGKTIGIIGYGSIGRAVAKIAKALGMRVLAVKRHNRSKESDVIMTTIEEIQRQADVISLHCDLNESNANMIDDDFISKLKDGVIILNTARGGLVDERAVARGIDSGKIKGYGADVLACEPPVQGSVLIGKQRCIITPHIAWASREARERLLKSAVDNIKAYLEGNPINIVY